MTPTSLSKALVVLDEARGKLLEQRVPFPKESLQYKDCSQLLRAINRIKKDLSHLLDTDQPTLGL